MKVGQLMECDFGDYSYDAFRQRIDDRDGHIAPEMVKNRLAVILNFKLAHGALVVPVSSSLDLSKVQRGLHVLIDPAYVTQTSFYDKRDRWALCDHVQQVSKKRLRSVTGARGYVTDILPWWLVAEIQKGVIAGINARSLLPPDAAGIPGGVDTGGLMPA
ncbi:type II toxin-antitoxin system PemK/MazF family toxin [Cupriavidus agavae]|uniref:Uncharacterized protein YifN (PemK superfamily) n=1 Tax=Cupriavidus agavae TaxID=1001822 RepID=A0A4Q7S3T4_9BURK|nr:type II toxin-antitoxin system PemK/MazF family toxin [Cupriavidus agavae]RZT41085.1 uncharacterized protein YifN (PemK superfamily) [Cupriavidus agavae]